MRFLQRFAPEPAVLGVFPGSFNPVTVAHIALSRAALASVDEVLFVLPATFPHKDYSGASLADRLEILRAALSHEPRISLAVSSGGLFAEIAAECREAYGPATRLWFLCGRDAAERFANWDYGGSGIPGGFDLLVAAREGEFLPPPGFPAGVKRLNPGAGCECVSSSEVRRRIAAGEAWEDLVPDSIHRQARRIYATS